MSPSKPAPAEPLAWAVQREGGSLADTIHETEEDAHKARAFYTGKNRVVPLYDHPAAPAEAERLRKALSEAIELLEDPETPQTKVSRKLAWMREVRDAALGGREEAP